MVCDVTEPSDSVTEAQLDAAQDLRLTQHDEHLAAINGSLSDINQRLSELQPKWKRPTITTAQITAIGAAITAFVAAWQKLYP